MDRGSGAKQAQYRYLSFWTADENVRTLTTTKHPASVMSLGFVASKGKTMDLIWFLTSYRLTGVNYIEILRTKFIPWVWENFPGGNVVLQQDGVPAHTMRATQAFLGQEMDFWAKDLWRPPQSSNANPLDYTFWPHIKFKACKLRHPNIDALKAAVNQEWAGMYEDFVSRSARL
ncbi:Putative transposable element [Caligus rogercresseyi]|uniref:Transposable element n=1 Tax=Caligus rogercresseyi TaxID=217165 RepID=A0A7T8HIG9_CALRO|nr:Putative transposable element [Caligus rogercresseyi]